MIWLERLGRSLRLVVELAGSLMEQNVGMKSLNDPIDDAHDPHQTLVGLKLTLMLRKLLWTRHSYNNHALAELRNLRPAEIRAFIHGQSTPGRTQELYPSRVGFRES